MFLLTSLDPANCSSKAREPFLERLQPGEPLQSPAGQQPMLATLALHLGIAREDEVPITAKIYSAS